MTPQEKAIQLVDKFYQTTPNEAWINEPLGLFEKYTAWGQSKQCALIAVNEIIDTIEYSSQADETSKIIYWDKVKEEIIKL